MIEKISVSLDEKHRRIIERHGRKVGVTAFSTALQSLIIQFDQMQKAAIPAAEAPTTEPVPAATAG